MTNLSKELCEICGIEPKGKLVFKKRDWNGTYISSAKGYKEFDFKSTPEVTVDIVPTKDYEETNGFLYPYSDIERIKEEYDKNGYDFVEFRQRTINFEQAENFVKLMDLKVEGLSASNLPLMGLLNKEYWLSSRPDYIEFLYKYYIPGLVPYWQEKLKQAIRQATWEV